MIRNVTELRVDEEFLDILRQALVAQGLEVVDAARWEVLVDTGGDEPVSYNTEDLLFKVETRTARQSSSPIVSEEVREVLTKEKLYSNPDLPTPKAALKFKKDGTPRKSSRPHNPSNGGWNARRAKQEEAAQEQAPAPGPEVVASTEAPFSSTAPAPALVLDFEMMKTLSAGNY
jgi:hypothetical protein